MAMTVGTAQRIAGAFLDAVGLSPDTQLDARRWAGFQLDQAAELLPEPEAWMVTGRGDEAALLLLAFDVLFTLTRELPLGQDRQVVVASHPARVTEVRYWRDGIKTYWHFQFRHRDPLVVDGRINDRAHPEDPETFDQAETFARSLATRAGWQAAEAADGVQKPSPDREPHVDELPDVGSSARSGARREQVTDLWGNPKPPKRRNR